MAKEERRFTFICVGVAVALGLCFRLPYILLSDFPLNDGGLFAQMIDELKFNSYLLPKFTEYNQAGIPFVYPPLGIYVAALITDVFNVSTIGAVKYIPIIFNILSIGGFVLLSTQILKNRATVLFASVIFPTMLGSYEWLIMGGGLTRSLGLFFALLAIYQAYFADMGRRSFIRSVLFLSAAGLSHPEFGVVAAVGTSVVILFEDRAGQGYRHRLLLLVKLGVGSLVLTAPWWGINVLRHGLAPFLAAGAINGQDVTQIIHSLATMEMFGYLTLPMALGFGINCYRGRWVLPVWVALLFLSAGMMAKAGAVPCAMLAAVGINVIGMRLLSLASAFRNSFNLAGKLHVWLAKKENYVPNYAVLIVLACAAYISAYSALNKPHSSLSSLTKGEVEAMIWVNNNTPPSSKFAVVSSAAIPWYSDSAAEWFPYLAERKSLTTAQGLEWRPEFESRLSEISRVKASQYLGDFPSTIEHMYDSIDYVVFFGKSDSFHEREKYRYEELVASDEYRIIFNNRSSIIFKKGKKARVCCEY